MPSRIWLPCRRAGLQRLRAVAGLDFEIIELKQQFCGKQTDSTVPSAHTGEGNKYTIEYVAMSLHECQLF